MFCSVETGKGQPHAEGRIPHTETESGQSLPTTIEFGQFLKLPKPTSLHLRVTQTEGLPTFPFEMGSVHRQCEGAQYCDKQKHVQELNVAKALDYHWH